MAVGQKENPNKPKVFGNIFSFTNRVFGVRVFDPKPALWVWLKTRGPFGGMLPSYCSLFEMVPLRSSRVHSWWGWKKRSPKSLLVKENIFPKTLCFVGVFFLTHGQPMAIFAIFSDSNTRGLRPNGASWSRGHGCRARGSEGSKENGGPGGEVGGSKIPGTQKTKGKNKTCGLLKVFFLCFVSSCLLRWWPCSYLGFWQGETFVDSAQEILNRVLELPECCVAEVVACLGFAPNSCGFTLCSASARNSGGGGKELRGSSMPKTREVHGVFPQGSFGFSSLLESAFAPFLAQKEGGDSDVGFLDFSFDQGYLFCKPTRLGYHSWQWKCCKPSSKRVLVGCFCEAWNLRNASFWGCWIL